MNGQPETEIFLGSNAYLFPIQLIHASITMIRALYKPRIYFHPRKSKVGSGTLLKQHCSITLTTALVPKSGGLAWPKFLKAPLHL